MEITENTTADQLNNIKLFDFIHYEDKKGRVTGIEKIVQGDKTTFNFAVYTEQDQVYDTMYFIIER